MLLLKGHASGKAVYAIAFSPDGTSLVSCSRDRTVRLWDLRERKHRIIGTTEGWLSRCVAYSPDGRDVAWPDRGGLQICDVAAAYSMPLPGEKNALRDISKVCFSPNGQTVAAAGGHVFLWHRATRQLLEAWGSGQSYGLAFAPDGRTLAAGRLCWLPNARYSYDIVLYELDTRQARATLSSKRIVNDLAFAPDGQILAATCEEYLLVWDLAQEQPIFQYKSTRRHFQGVAFSPDGSLLAAAHNDRTVRLWRTGDWTEHGAFDWGIGDVLCVAFAPDGMTAAAGGRSGRIVLWDVDV